MALTSSLAPLYTLLLGLAVAPYAEGHGGDSHIAAGEAISEDPIMIAWGVIFPIGMVLGIVKSRWHVPVQSVGTVMSILGYFLGHMHGGRQFRHNNIHAQFASLISFLLFLQVAMGIYLKLHLEKGINGKIRPYFKIAHGILGKSLPVLAWIQFVFGGITALGFCQGDHLGQCLVHFIMGSAFIAYGIILTLVLLVGQLWIRRTGRSQEFFDSVVIAAWGCVNTFTEHRWGTDWTRKDWEHTATGIIWWCAGLAGVWFSKDRDGRPQRNFIPGFVLLMTGWAMSSHPQDLPISAESHKIFGYTLVGAGITRIIEICFVLRDRDSLSKDGRRVNSFQYIPVFLLYASGFLFMGSNEEQLDLVANSGLDHVAYILILFSLAFMVFLFVNMLINIYDGSANPEAQIKETANGRLGPRLNGNVPVRDAQEFELEGLMSDDGDDDDDRKQNERTVPDTPTEGLGARTTLRDDESTSDRVNRAE
ncbi:hypothetical protein DL766_005839 [Monosporascus sp. MC13-8B]|uniref:Cytochrome b561 domain-containing protein n=1 Tax=Monosporascus cannonballus TaxID=155416 RepID=A0ABY0H7K9_9PEZI|nr:hypothetical protein DL762_005998 [Monosporascus cannonballus]RYO83970.1 hypothetical protein DL763_007648 [Monosporascus cannonballus]RYP28487.1 hypothetical protein DL766_005839 [Monosporascus sp. MC13-8B]